jgi:hypothetical protein
MAFAQEMRRQPRVAYSEKIWIGQDGIFSQTGGQIRNISTSGAFIETTQSFSSGNVVNLRFSLGRPQDLISCSAIVRNVQPGQGFGVEFLDLSTESRSYIAMFVTGLAGPMGRIQTAGL